jgi:hypothetical protein
MNYRSLAAVFLAALPVAMAVKADIPIDWVPVGKTGKEPVMLNPKSIRALGGDRWQVWARFVHLKVQSDGSSESKILINMDCSDHIYAIAYTISYRQNGDIVGRESRKTDALEWEPAVPDSPSGDIVDVVCTLAHDPSWLEAYRKAHP